MLKVLFFDALGREKWIRFGGLIVQGRDRGEEAGWSGFVGRPFLLGSTYVRFARYWQVSGDKYLSFGLGNINIV